MKERSVNHIQPTRQQVNDALNSVFSDESVVLSYTRRTQKLVNGDPLTARCCETRIWQKLGGSWKQVHVHRS